MTHISRLLERTVLSKLQRTCVCVCPVLAVMHTRVRVLGGIPAVFYTSRSLRSRSVLQVGITSCFSSRKSCWLLTAKIVPCVYLAVKVKCVSVRT